MDEINLGEQWTSLQDMNFSNEFDGYIRDLEERRRKIEGLIN